MLRHMQKDAATNGQTHARKGEFHKVGENLYRYSSNDRYYAVFRVNGKLIWKSLKTSDRELAKRKLKEEQEKQGRVDPEATKLTLSGLEAVSGHREGHQSSAVQCGGPRFC